MWERGEGSASHWGIEQGFLEEGTFGVGPEDGKDLDRETWEWRAEVFPAEGTG